MITLANGQYLSDVMKEIPSNCILSKRIPGCGATTLELDTNRSSIIVVPNVPVIVSKCNKYPNLLGVYEGVNLNRITKYLNNNRTRKIMTTPESFDKVKTACEKCGINIYSDFFLLMDECHQLIKDVDYRPDMVIPMNDFFLFNRKALVSATPIGFSDPRFEENFFDIVEVTADYDYQQDITVTHTYNIAKAVGEYLENHNGTVCFFVNSIVEIYSIMEHFDMLNDATVYCAPKSRNKLKKEYTFTNAHTEWNAKTMKKYNFFTGRFFTAFDLELDYKPDLVMITDPYNAEYTMLDIDTDCIQICGRFRNGINSATHIHRTNSGIIIQTKEEVLDDISKREYAYNLLQTLYNSSEYIEYRKAFGEILEISPYRKYLYPDFTKNWFAIDNAVNETLVTNRYHSRSKIMQWYNECHYFKPKFEYYDYNENDEKMKIINKATSIKGTRKQMVKLLSELEEPYTEYALDFINEMRKVDPFIVHAYELLGKERIEELKYNETKIGAEIIMTERKGNKAVRLVKNYFKTGCKYSNKDIVDKLTEIFSSLNLHPEEAIKPNTICQYFQALECWVGKGRGYLLISELV